MSLIDRFLTLFYAFRGSDCYVEQEKEEIDG